MSRFVPRGWNMALYLMRIPFVLRGSPLGTSSLNLSLTRLFFSNPRPELASVITG